MKDLALPEETQFYTRKTLLEAGYSNYFIRKMLERNILRKFNGNVFINSAYNGNISEYDYISAISPKAVICLLSAARYYELTSFLPDAVDIAIANSMKISSCPEWPQLHIYYFANERYKTGIVTNERFRMYDIEKTVIDIISYRNKVGIEETKEILKNYLAKPHCNLNKLLRYADIFGAKKILRTYLEVLL